MHWQPLGVSFPALLGEVRYGLVLTDTPLTDKDGNATGILLPETARVTVLEAGDWVPLGSDFHRSYRVSFKAAGKTVQGWIDSAAAALILAQNGRGLAVGVLPRKIVVGGGESEYSLLVGLGRRGTRRSSTPAPFRFPTPSIPTASSRYPSRT